MPEARALQCEQHYILQHTISAQNWGCWHLQCHASPPDGNNSLQYRSVFSHLPIASMSSTLAVDLGSNRYTVTALLGPDECSHADCTSLACYLAA